MSRIGKLPIEVPDGVDVTIDGQLVTVKGPLGTEAWTFRPEMTITKEGNVIQVTRPDDSKQSRSLHGLSRTLLNNMVVGVKSGFVKNLEMVGVGYRAQVQGKKLVMQLGYSHPIEMDINDGLEVKVEANTKIEIKGASKQMVGQFAADVRKWRPPEPYKGKGIKFAGEIIRRKAGKSGK